MSGQVMVTFDDGTTDQFNACEVLIDNGIPAVVGIASKLMGTPGFMSLMSLEHMKDDGHFICNHSATHPWLGKGAEKPGLTKMEWKDVLQDYESARDELNKLDFHGDYLMVPFGSWNIDGEVGMASILEKFQWIRMTIGAPLPEQQGLWTIDGAKRLYPRNYLGRSIGITAAADIRDKSRTERWVRTAEAADALCVLVYHRVGHPVGSGQDITWEHFLSEVKMLTEAKERGVEFVLPTDLVPEETK